VLAVLIFPCLLSVDCENFVDAPLISSEVEIEREIENFCSAFICLLLIIRKWKNHYLSLSSQKTVLTGTKIMFG
jgi:hypothetical protein